MGERGLVATGAQRVLIYFCWNDLDSRRDLSGDEMTWGSNASYDKLPCPYCGWTMIDDSDEWPTSHMIECHKRPKFRVARFLRRLIGMEGR